MRAFMTSSLTDRWWDERTSAVESLFKHSGVVFETLFERSADAIWLYDPQTAKLVDCNHAAVELIGAKEKQQLLPLRPEDISSPLQPDGSQSADKTADIFGKVVQERGTHRFEWVIRRLDGREVPIVASSTAMTIGGKTMHVVIMDNTQRQRAEPPLRESEENFRALFESSSQGVVLLDDKAILKINPAAVRIMRRQCPMELLGKHPGEMAPALQPNGEPSSSMARKFVSECMTQGSARFEWIASAPDGEEIPLEVALTRIQWSGRQVIQAFITDITERKRAQTALAESEARFSAAFHASPALIGILRTSDGKYVLANDAHLTWLGYVREEVVGRTCVELGMWEDLSERDLLLKDMSTSGSIRQRECRWRNRRGERFTFLLSAEIIKLNDTPHMLLMALDITQRKRAEEELLKTLEREKDLGRLKSNFVSMVSHEFRTPLSIIQSSSELLRDFYRKMHPAERDDQLESIIRNSRRMTGMMEEILVLSRLDAGKLEFRPSPLDLEAFCRRVRDEVLSAMQGRCDIELAFAPALPKAQADERLLGHIFTNVLSNAVKYSQGGAPVRFSVSRDGARAVCVISDEGIGIPEEDQTRLFTAFHRGANVGSRPGTGLGLVLVKRCVELHRGRVQIQSALARGTNVTISLPAFGVSYDKNTDN